MKSLIFLTLLILLPLHCFAQQKPGPVSLSRSGSKDAGAVPASQRCTVKLADLPLFHQIRVGMIYDEFKDIYPEIKTDKHFQSKYATDGSGYFALESASAKKASYKEDFEQLSLSFIDQKVQIIAVMYNEAKWTSLNDAIIGLSNTLGLSEGNWTRYYEQSAMAECEDFKIYANSQQFSDQKRQNSMSIHPEGN